MAKIKYEDWNPKPESLHMVQLANDIIKDYQAMGYTLTLRQLYYQFVSKDLIPNTERSYKNLGTLVTKARMAGMISWKAIEDRGRSLNNFWVDENILNPIKGLPSFIRFDRWLRQEYYVEVWVEKEALGNVITRACNQWLVPNMACKGYLSASEAWRAGQRMEKIAYEQHKQCVVIHLGDHDPSGIDMTRDNRDRLEVLSRNSDIIVERIALNSDQIEEYQPPPNPAKLSDSRAKDYIKKFGKQSWELDALNPSILEDLIASKIQTYIDFTDWDIVGVMEEEAKDKLKGVFDNWDKIENLIIKEDLS